MGSRPSQRALPSWLPHGGSLPADVWAVRHRWVVTVLAVQVLALPLYALRQGFTQPQALAQLLVPAAALLVACWSTLSRRIRSAGAAAGLVVVASIVVHLSGGVVEAHFLFFVMIPIVALYEDWVPFGLAVCYVFLQHGIAVGLNQAGAASFDDPARPWLSALVHVVAFGAAALGAVVGWKLHERARAEQDVLAAELLHHASHDSLTGLPNRVALAQQGRDTLDTSRRVGVPVSVLLIDLDRFKELNDTLGHAAGDALLREVADRLRGHVRAEDLLARLGGDEFALLLPGCSTEEARHLAWDVRSALHEVIGIDELRVDTDASIGVAGVRADGSLVGDRAGDEPLDPGADGVLSELLRRADVAMYVAKHGRHAVAVYTREEDANDRSRLTLLADLRRQLDEAGLMLFYQPKVDLRTGQVVGMEALVRWGHAERGLLLPEDFLAAAESSGLIESLTVQVIDLALAQVARWELEGVAVPVAVNISPRCLFMDLPRVVQDALETYRVDPSMLRLEITENTIMADPEHAVATLRTLRAAGVALSIDDFGSGYAGLSYLRRLPVDELKLDRLFIDCLDQPDLRRDDPDVLIVRSTIELGRSLGLTVVGEGVETRRAYDVLRSMGCDQAQGFLIARPMPALLATAWLRSRHGPAVDQDRTRGAGDGPGVRGLRPAPEPDRADGRDVGEELG